MRLVRIIWSLLRFDFLDKISKIQNLPHNILLVTIDVVFLYTNIPHDNGFKELKHVLNIRHQNYKPATRFIT